MPATQLEDIDRDAAVQNFRSAKSYMRIALGCCEEGDAEGALFWRDHMALDALKRALHFREEPAAKATRHRRILAGEGELVSYPDEVRAVLKDARGIVELAATFGATDAGLLAEAIERDDAARLTDGINAYLATPAPKPGSLLATFAKKAPTTVPTVEEKKTQPTGRRLIGML